MARMRVLVVAAVTAVACLITATMGVDAGGLSMAAAAARAGGGGESGPTGWSAARWVMAAVASARRAGWASARVNPMSRQTPDDALPNPPAEGDAAAAAEASSVLINTATLQPIPAVVPFKHSLLFVNLFVEGTNFTDAINELIIGCSSKSEASGVLAGAWDLVNATRFTNTLLQANYAVVVEDSHTGGFSLRWINYVRSGALAVCAGLPDGSVAASVAPFDARASVATPARTFGVWVPALIIGLAALAALLGIAGYALAHMTRHYEKADLADPDAPEFATVEEGRDVERADSDDDDDSGYDSEQEVMPVSGSGSNGGSNGSSGGGTAAAAPAGAAGANVVGVAPTQS
ncbi:hypothetical protein MMPV_005322 [Pyropia vietnamensis]